MPIGSRLFPTVCRAARIAEALEAVFELDLTDLAALNCHSATAAISNANERRMPVSFVGKKSRADVYPIRTRLLDRGCGCHDITKTGPRDDTKLAAIKLEWWPRSDWNRWPPSLESGA